MNYYQTFSRSIFTLKTFAPLRLCVFALIFSSFTFAQTLAPGAPGKDAQWATAGKQGVGTSANLESKVWFTLAQGVMTEVYYPDVTVANVHLLQFIIVGETGKVETEQNDAIHKIEVLIPENNPRSKDYHPQSSYSLTFKQINTAKSGAWKMTKTYITDPNSDVILIDVKFEGKGHTLYLDYDPSLANSGMSDTAWTEDGALLANDGNIFSALVFSHGKLQPNQLKETTNGFHGINDGVTQLQNSKETNIRKNLTAYEKAGKGNVVQVAKIPPEYNGATYEQALGYSWSSDYEFTLALAFGSDKKGTLNKARQSLFKGFEKTRYQYEQGWFNYLNTVKNVDKKYQAQFNMAAMQLKAHEDKTIRGANIASLSVPWGGGDNANEANIGGYHLIWSRDLYQVATAFMALGDRQAAIRALDFLFKVQQKPDGSFPQNSYLDGKPFWGALQLDEVAFPLILAYQLGRNDKATYENHVKRAADFIVKNGPVTPQERWEEEGGYSPSTIAAEIAGLVCAAEIARKNGDETSAILYLKTADEWQSNIEKWTVTKTGKYSKEPYYLRITQGKPDSGAKLELNNGAGFFDERDIVDAGFLELVRLGIKSPDDPIIQNSLKVIDEVIRVKTPNGDAFYRYNNDGYGEMDDGRRWNWDGKYTGKGRLWALLSGERGQYELARAYSYQVNAETKKVDFTKLLTNANELKKARLRLDSMLAFANEGLMIPEQIWDKPTAPNADKQFVPELKFGEGTGSATPLAWSMAQFIRLAVNLQEGRNLDTPDIIYNRYVLGKKSEASSNNSEFIITQEEVNCSAAKANHIEERRAQKFPVIKKCGGKTHYAVLAYNEKAEKVEIVGDFTNWKPSGLFFEPENFGPAGPTKREYELIKNKKYRVIEFAPTARVEYKLIVDGKWINDPLNPNKVDNGVGGENSFFTMPDYKPTNLDGGEMPKLETIEIESKVFGEKRKIQIYQPPETIVASLKATNSIASGNTRRPNQKIAPTLKVSNFNTIYSTLSASESVLFANVGFHPTLLNLSASPTENGMPVLYLQDGGEYINRAKAIQIQHNLVAAGKIEPFIMVFLDPKDRMKEYWANDDYAKYVAAEVVPAIDAKYKTIKSRDGRAIMGASLGGITSVHVGLKYPEIFGRVGGQSSSFWVDNERVVKELEKLDGKTKFKFYFDDGTLEGVEDSRKVVKILKDKGFDVTYTEAEAGHNWTAWRDRLADAFIAIWK